MFWTTDHTQTEQSVFMLSLPVILWLPIQATDCIVHLSLVHLLQTGIYGVKKWKQKEFLLVFLKKGFDFLIFLTCKIETSGTNVLHIFGSLLQCASNVSWNVLIVKLKD